MDLPKDLPEVGDEYTCQECGMTLEITADCGCVDVKCVSFMCCGKEMT